MKKALGIGVMAIVAGMTAAIILRGVAQETVSAPSEVSEFKAKLLQGKIDAVQTAAEIAILERSVEQLDVTEEELESFVIYSLRDEIPLRVDSIEVQLLAGAVSADVTVTSNGTETGNPMVDVLLAGTHSLFVKGKLSATGAMGRFELEEVKVDGIPVPPVLIETLVEKYVKPRYPHVDLKEPFTMPWGIDELAVIPGRATVVY